MSFGSFSPSEDLSVHLSKQEEIGQIDSKKTKKANRLHMMMNNLKTLASAYNLISEFDQTDLVKYPEEIFQILHSQHYEYEEFWKLGGVTQTGELHPKIYKDLSNRIYRTTIKTEKEDGQIEETVDTKQKAKIDFYLQNWKTFYSDLFQKWNVRISPLIFETIMDKEWTGYRKGATEILIDFVINRILWGDFAMKEECYQMFGCTHFFVEMQQDYWISASINLERSHIINENGTEIIGQKFEQSIKLLNIYYKDEINWVQTPPQERIRANCLIQNDPDKYKLFQEPLVRRVFKVGSYSIVNRAYQRMWTFYGEDNPVVTSYNEEGLTAICIPIDLKFAGRLITSAYSQFEFDGKRWVLENEGKYYTAGVKLDIKAEQAINQESNKEMVLKFFENLEQYGIKFEANQKRMLVSSGNTLALGRSGTGKTTVSAFKMIAIDLLFKAYAKAKLTGRSNVQLEAKDLSIYSGCNTIFCTASPVLTNEVRRFYNELNTKIKEFLIKKQEKKLKKMQEKEEPEVIEKPVTEEKKLHEENEDKETEEAREMQESIKIALESTKQDLEDEFEEAAQKNIPASIDNLQQDNFPCFVTVKKLIYMLDAALGYPFFSRSVDGKIYGMDSSTEWHNENKHGTFMINQYHKDSYDFSKKLKKLGKKVLQAEDLDDDEKVKRLKEEGIDEEADEKEDKKENEEDIDSDLDDNYDNADIYANIEYMNDQKQAFSGDLKILDQTFSQEVDFDMFEQRFWGKNKGRIKISAMNVWTEIFSVIKGGLQTDWWSFVRRGSYSIMSHSCYMRIKSSMPYLDPKERNQLYWIYVKYEGWKAKHNYYDFMDVVRHVFYYYPTWWRTKIDYLIVDEVQDLTPLTIQLLVSVTNKNVFFCGDTAQTIAKGVGFRFHDLKDIFDNKKVSIPSVIQLTKNYRSHGKILELANTIVDLIEFLFPQTIDKLQRESSDLDGPKPILLEDYTDEDLMAMIIGHSETRNPSFGCNQVVIVRDQETKNTLPIFLKQALCLTVYEAKGLEFDDVILYNFFCDSEATGQYRILKDLEIHTGKRRKVKIETDLTINELDLREFKKRMRKLEEEAKMMDGEEEDDNLVEEYNYLQINRDTSDILRNFSLLCNDLKHLYVSVTRPKQRLLIYDQDTGNRNAIKQYWVECGVVDVVKKGQEKDHPVLKDGFEALADEANSKIEWRYMGIRLFRKKFYMSAASCFKQSDDLDLENRCYAYHHADKAASLNSEAEALLYMAKNNKNLARHERNKQRNDAKTLKHDAMREYENAGEMFKKIKCFRQAAQCYYTSHKYDEAAELFIQEKMFAQAAECYMITKQFEEAAKMFEESNLILRALECYEYLRDWEGVLLCLNRNKDQFKENQRESLINKYVPIALNSIFRMLSNGDQTEENRGKALEDKYLKNIPAIQEEESDFDSQDEDGDKEEVLKEIHEEDAKQEEEKVEDKSEQEINPFEDSVISEPKEEIKGNDDEEEEQIITTKNQAQITSKDDDSFSVISKTELQDNFEHLSNFDPEDEFLSSNKSYSVVGSIVSNDEDTISQYSDFSILSDSRVSNIVPTNTIETNRDIYIEDVVMQKIIYYVSLFSEDTKNYLKKLRSKSQLFVQKEGDFKADAFELELDNIDTELVKILLDVLESFDMFRLCMIVCNRYNVTEHLSRYLTSVCFKYSNIKLLNTEAIMEMNHPVFRKKQQQVSILANEAIHNMFSLINPGMVKQYKTEDIDEETRVQRQECWRMLFYLGFWKKLVYIVDSMTSLELCYTTGDLKNFKIVYMLNYRETLSDEEIKVLMLDQSAKWIDPSLDRNSKLGVLCYKVALEEIIEGLEVEMQVEGFDAFDSFECNLMLNKWVKQTEQERTESDDEFLRESLRIASQKLSKIMGSRSCEDKISLFDIFTFYGRLFTDKAVSFNVSKIMETNLASKGYDGRSFALKCALLPV